MVMITTLIVIITANIATLYPVVSHGRKVWAKYSANTTQM